MADYKSVLTDHGFTADESALTSLREERKSLSNNGAYDLKEAFTGPNGATAILEQNTSPDGDGEVTYTVNHPAMLVISTPRGGVAVKPAEVDALKDALTALGL